MDAVRAGWLRDSISITMSSSRIWNSATGCNRCPLKRFTTLFRAAGGVSSLIQFQMTTNSDRQCVFGTPCNTYIYESYVDSVSNGHVVLLYFYSDGATSAKSGTQSAKFYRVRFTNLKGYSEDWFTVSIAPTTTSIPASLPVD